MRISIGQWFLTVIAVLISWNAGAANTDLDKELLYRLRFSNPQDIQLLLDRGASANAQSEEGIPALTLVQDRTDDQILPLMKELVAKGADVNNGGTAKKPPLIRAASAGNMPVVKYLVEDAKANLNILDAQNYSAVQMAKQNGRQDAEAYLMQAIANQKPLKPHTPEYMALQERLLAYHSCSRQYLFYYYATKQDPVPEKTQKDRLQEQQDAMRAAANDLYQIFRVPADAIADVQQRSSASIAKELNALISNRNRRANGVGKDEDMKKRCDKIAEETKLNKGMLLDETRNR